MSGIRVSKKHGVNPTIPICAWCGKEKNEIALLGYMNGDIEAPMHMILDYEPCDKCKAEWEKGVAILEVSTTPITKGQFPISEGAYPTGRYVVIKPETLNGEHKNGERLLMIDYEFKQMISGGN